MKTQNKENREGSETAIVIAITISIVIVFTAISMAMLVPFHYDSGTAGFGSGQSGVSSSTFFISNATFQKMNSVPPDVLVNRSNNTITVSSNEAKIIVEAAPSWYPRPGDFWLIYGLVNPTIIVKDNTTINFVFINMDNITHMPAITTVSPPYSYMPMQQNMMGYVGNTGSWPAIGSMLPATSGQSQQPVYAATNLSMAFNSSGNYYYICLIPGHAEMGMYGKISVIT
ncbi:MAG: plastocyanin/azurin family copper-binding protein [Candidatus Parvarchaeota archaeon]